MTDLANKHAPVIMLNGGTKPKFGKLGMDVWTIDPGAVLFSGEVRGDEYHVARLSPVTHKRTNVKVSPNVVMIRFFE